MTKRNWLLSFISFLVFIAVIQPTQAGTLPSGSITTFTKAQCESPKANGGQGGRCNSRFPTSTVDGCVAVDTFVGFCDNNSFGCCVETVSTSVTTTAQCLATKTADGKNSAQCSTNDANCFKLNTSTNVWAPIGYCDSPANSCCLPGAAGGGTGPGTTFYCESTLKGKCIQSSTGCTNGGFQIDTCTTDAAGARLICCSIPEAKPVGALNYTLLEEIPGSGSGGTSGNFALYLQKLYNFTFWAIGVAALFMLTVGGFMYVTSAGNTSRVETAKTIITDSLLGIIVALFAWLFLYVINPDLVEGLQLANTVPTPVASTPSGGTGTPPGSGGPQPTDVRTIAQQILAGGTGISLSGSGSCATADGTAVSPRFTMEQIAAGTPVNRCQNGCPSKGACTQTTNISLSMLQAMLAVAKTKPFTVSSITGGSHCEIGVPNCKSLSAHYTGSAIDITTSNKGDWPAIISAFRAQYSSSGQTFCDLNGTPLPVDRCGEANHIHVAF